MSVEKVALEFTARVRPATIASSTAFGRLDHGLFIRSVRTSSSEDRGRAVLVGPGRGGHFRIIVVFVGLGMAGWVGVVFVVRYCAFPSEAGLLGVVWIAGLLGVDDCANVFFVFCADDDGRRMGQDVEPGPGRAVEGSLRARGGERGGPRVRARRLPQRFRAWPPTFAARSTMTCTCSVIW